MDDLDDTDTGAFGALSEAEEAGLDLACSLPIGEASDVDTVAHVVARWIGRGAV